MHDLTRFLYPMQSIPSRLELVPGKGVQRGGFPGIHEAAVLFAAWDAAADGVRSDRQVRVLVTCTTALPRFLPALHAEVQAGIS